MVTEPGGGGPHSGRKEDHTQGGRRTTLREEGGPYSRKTTAEGRLQLQQEGGHSREDTYTHSSGC